ncbi:MAG: AAA family ATPase [Desulforhopalus sp.]|nr:AAA family ATPase [Desulforhopalus sp.]
MRITRLDLRAVGPFTGRCLEFSTEAPGLHLVFGPNEAGKSSSLRALKALLFGFPQQTPDNFLHSYDQLVVAGCLRNSTGQELSFQRRKRRLGDLLDMAGNPLDPAGLAPFLHGLDASLFAGLYGIDHDALVRGGEEILARKGEAGQTLFAAGAGLSSIAEVIGQLEKEAGDLFKATGQLPAINGAVRQFKDLQKEARSAGLSVKDWKEHHNALETALAARKELEGQRDHNSAELHRLERLRQVVAELAALQASAAHLHDLGEVALLTPDFNERYQQVSRELREGEQRLQRDSERLEKLLERRSAVAVNTLLLRHAGKVDDFHQRLGEYNKGRKDRPERNGMRISLRSEAGRLLQQVRPDLSLEKVEVLRPVLAKKRMVQALAAHYEAMHQQLVVAERQGRVANEEYRQVEAGLAALPQPIDTGLLLLAIRAAQKAGDLDGQLAKTSSGLSLQRQECRADLQRIGLWKGDLAGLVELALPLPVTVQRFEKDFGEIDEARRELATVRRGLEKELPQIQAEIKKVDYAGDLPREEELSRSRAERDRGWRLLRRQWLNGEDVSHESNAYAGEKPLAEVYEGYIGVADTISDRLRREADRVAGAAALRARAEALQVALESNSRDVQALELRADTLTVMWRDSWLASGILPLSPREMSAWLAEIETVRFKLADLGKKENQFHLEWQTRKGLGDNLRKALAAIGATGPAGEELAPLLTAGENILTRLTDQEKKRDSLRERCEKAARGWQQAEDDLARARDALTRWQEQWRKALAGLDLAGEVSSLEAVDMLETLQSCFDKLKEADDLQKRIDGIDRDAGLLALDVGNLVSAVAPELADLPLDQAILQLRILLGKAQKDDALNTELAKDIRGLQEEIELTKNTLNYAKEQMTELLRLADCRNPDDLPAVMDKFAEYQRLREKIVHHEENLAKIGAGVPLTELAVQAAAVNIDEVPSMIEALNRDTREVLNPEINRLSQIVGEESSRLLAMDGGARAADLAEAMERELALIRRLTSRYILVKLAAKVLQQAIERYREEHQDPVLKIAAGYFSKLTLGSFAGLRTDVDDAGQPVLVGVRDNGLRLTVDKMSSGTRDQMFLALRLASLEWRWQTEEPMPFIIDDILINFDDLRARACLEILAGLGEKNQVILFTHHRRIVEESKLLAGQECIQIHELCPAA